MEFWLPIEGWKPTRLGNKNHNQRSLISDKQFKVMTCTWASENAEWIQILDPTLLADKLYLPDKSHKIQYILLSCYKSTYRSHSIILEWRIYVQTMLDRVGAE